MGHRFKPDCLPDTRSPGIEDSFGSLLPILLPSGHFQIQGVIFRLYHNLVFPILYKVRYLHTKANVSTDVIGSMLTVNPNIAFIVHSTKMEEYSFTLHMSG